MKVPPLTAGSHPVFGSSGPLCVVCGASAESRYPSGVGREPTLSVLCREHWQTECELTTQAIARAGQRLKELEGEV